MTTQQLTINAKLSKLPALRRGFKLSDNLHTLLNRYLTHLQCTHHMHMHLSIFNCDRYWMHDNAFKHSQTPSNNSYCLRSFILWICYVLISVCSVKAAVIWWLRQLILTCNVTLILKHWSNFSCISLVAHIASVTYTYTVFQKSDAKIQITITMAHLIRINYPLSSFNYRLSGTKVANFNKIPHIVSEKQLFKKWNLKTEFSNMENTD